MNILSVDGGFSAPVQLRLLRVVEQANPGFLAATDLFAGVSDGASVALYLALKLGEGGATPLEIIDGAIAFSNELTRVMHATFCGLFRALTGTGSFLLVEPFQSALKKGFGDTTLSQLKKNVAIVSFDINTKTRTIFGALHPSSPMPNGDLPLYEVNWASGALPFFCPVYATSNGHYYSDGGLVDNNPSMAAVVSALSHMHDSNNPSPQDLAPLRVLSLGSTARGAIATFTDPSSLWDRMLNWALGSYSPLLQVAASGKPITSRTWGYLQWMLPNPFAPLNLVDAAISSSIDGECRQLLHGNYCRYAPMMPEIPEGMMVLFLPPFLTFGWYDRMAAKLAEQPEFVETMRWIAGTWMPR